MMTENQAALARHSVRRYLDKPLEAATIEALKSVVDECNAESGLHIQLITNEPKAFNGMMAHYGKFYGVKNYIALVGKKSDSLFETCGYYGERIVLAAQSLGLNTCWVALTYKKVPDAFSAASGEKLAVVISLGYGESQGIAHKSKPVGAVSRVKGEAPEWFYSGVQAALLAPTAVNQQKFILSYDNGTVTAEAGTGFFSKLDLGIVKYHFELGAGKENFKWNCKN